MLPGRYEEVWTQPHRHRGLGHHQQDPQRHRHPRPAGQGENIESPVWEVIEQRKSENVLSDYQRADTL